jgi:hypothetical protein
MYSGSEFVACWLIGQQQEVYYFKHIIRLFTNQLHHTK